MDLKAKLDEIELAMTEFLAAGRITTDTHAKVMLSVAHDHAVGLRAFGEAERIVKLFPAEYYDSTFPRQCAEDEMFRRSMYALARALVDAGMADIGPRYQFNRPPALA